MLLLLLPLNFILLALVFRRRGEDWRRAILIAAAALGAILVAITETLSLFHLLTPTAIALGWMGVAAVLGVLWARLPRQSPPNPKRRLGWVD